MPISIHDNNTIKCLRRQIQTLRDDLAQANQAAGYIEDQRSDQIRVSAELANALNEINNTCGELSEVKEAMQKVQFNIDFYKGRETY